MQSDLEKENMTASVITAACQGKSSSAFCFFHGEMDHTYIFSMYSEKIDVISLACFCSSTLRYTTLWKISCVQMSSLMNDWFKCYPWGVSWVGLVLVRTALMEANGSLAGYLRAYSTDADFHIHGCFFNFCLLTYKYIFWMQRHRCTHNTQTIRSGGRAPLSLASRCVTARL